MLKHIASLIVFICFSMGFAFADEVDPSRFNDDIAKVEKRIARGDSKPGEVLFVGSSSIRLWDLKKSFPEQSYNNHGFGGSHISDVIHFFDRVVTPVKPSVIVFYAGDNDLAAKKTPETVVADYKRFMKLVDEKCPDCHAVVYIPVKPSIKRWEQRDVQMATNAAIAGLSVSNSKLHTVDIVTPMLGPDGTPRKELFAEDGLHLSRAGYEIWTRIVRDKLNALGRQPK